MHGPAGRLFRLRRVPVQGGFQHRCFDAVPFPLITRRLSPRRSVAGVAVLTSVLEKQCGGQGAYRSVSDSKGRIGRLDNPSLWPRHAYILKSQRHVSQGGHCPARRGMNSMAGVYGRETLTCLDRLVAHREASAVEGLRDAVQACVRPCESIHQ